MRESMRIAQLFEDIYDGDPWMDVNFLSNLKRIDTSQASLRIYPDWNTIWEILNHLISWREVVLARLQGKSIPSPEHNYFLPVTDTSPKNWKETLSRLEQSQEAWISFLRVFNEEDFEKNYPGTRYNYYELIHGILQHDAYHLGQIVIMIKRVVQTSS
jgi:uncharacterized damage-inducible protein DinB